jgi:hypothetical protein
VVAESCRSQAAILATSISPQGSSDSPRGVLTLTLAGGKAPTGGRTVNEWRDEGTGLIARAVSGCGLQWIDWQGVGVFAFSPGSDAVQVWPSAQANDTLVVETFSRFVRPRILQSRGWQLIHAGASVGPRGVLAFCGKSGSGKSTLAYAMQEAGWRQFADDALLLRSDEDRIRACPLPFESRLRPASRAHFAGHGTPSLPDPPSSDMPLAALYLLRQDVNLAGPRVSLVPRPRAFSQVLAHADCFNAQDAEPTRRLVEGFLKLVAAVPVFAVEYRPVFQDLGRLIRLVADTAAAIPASGTVAEADSLQ